MKIIVKFKDTLVPDTNVVKIASTMIVYIIILVAADILIFNKKGEVS